MSKLWGGRFSKATHEAVERFTSSLKLDSRLWEADIAGSIAHARMLGKTGILNLHESQQLIWGLEEVRKELTVHRENILAVLDPASEDIHTEIERRLTEKLGELAGKLHTGRSRNDQVGTATRLYLKGEITELLSDIQALQNRLLISAEPHTETIMPGFTHLQHAQPVSLAHHLMAYFWMFGRDRDRLVDLQRRVSCMPLGSAALAGTSFPIDREMTAHELGFETIHANSLDAVSDRDFVVEFLAAAALIMTHLSRLCEELILWSTPEFGFIELDDSVTTGSSIMPQKKNPDVAELIRGKVGRVHGALVGSLTMLKGLPLSYNRDLQEDKTFLFEGLDTSRASVQLMNLMLESAEFRPERMKQALKGCFSNATDLADYLVRKGLTFRQAHEIVGAAVRSCSERGISLEDLTPMELQALSPFIERDVIGTLSPLAVLQARTSAGGTGPQAVRKQMEDALEFSRLPLET